MPSADKLISWNSTRDILYPWIHETDPYKILLSEFLLQQTRSAQAVGYYEKMLAVFPTVAHLAEAPEDALMKQWQGLGYYSRARNLHKAAKQIMTEHGGKVPSTYDQLIQLPGIGPYTAAAISSFAFGERRAVVDGNVYRVLARIYAIDTPINSSPARKEFTTIAQALIAQVDPAAFNQAIMNLGAQVCTPKQPDCDTCPWQSDCTAYREGRQLDFPIKKRKAPNKNRYFHFLDISIKNRTLIQRREGKDVWQGLYQFPLLVGKSSRKLAQRSIGKALEEMFGIDSWTLDHVTEPTKQVLSHQNIHARFYQISAEVPLAEEFNDFTLVIRKNLVNFAFPRTISWYLNSNDYDQ